SKEEERRIALVKSKAGKVPVPGHEEHQQQTKSRTNQHPQCARASGIPPIRAANNEWCQKCHRKIQSGDTTEHRSTNRGRMAKKIHLKELAEFLVLSRRSAGDR